MPRLSRSSLVGPVLYSLAFGAIGLAYVGPSTFGPRLVPGLRSAASPPPVAEGGPSCPLPVGQQAKAVRAFRAMMPVFQHPRCFNCHGGFDIFSKKHPGEGQLDRAMDFREPMPPDVRMGAFAEQCEDCHDGLKTPGGERGWTTSPPPMFFVHPNGARKSAEQLCRQMKEQEPTRKGFVGHIENDHEGIQFIAAAFVGDRALGKEGLEQYKLTAQPPPGSQGQLTEKAQDWVDILGEGGYKASRECGCVMPKIKLEVHHTEVMSVPHGLPSKEESDVKFQVNLEPAGDDKPGLYLGQRSLTRTIKMTLPKFCTGKSSRGERWEFWGLIDSVTGAIKVSQVAFDELPTGGIECKSGRGTAKMGLFPAAAPAGSAGFHELVIPPDSGSSKTVKAGNKTWNESLTITVLEVPGK
jgi:hypothetical protein